MKKSIKFLALALSVIMLAGLVGTLTGCVKDKFEAVEYAITYDLAGGENHDDNPNKYEPTSPPLILAAKDRDNFIFDGWTSEINETPESPFQIPENTMRDLKFTAHWTEIIILETGYSINYALNNGMFEGTAPDKYEENDADVTIPNPIREDWDFVGWSSPQLGITPIAPQKDLVVPASTAKNVVLTAHWSEKPIVPKVMPAGYEVGKVKAPVFTFYQANGTKQPVSLADYYGKKPVLVNMWKKDCPGCIAEVIPMSKVYQEMSAKFEILAVCVDTEANLAADLKNNNYIFPVLSDFNKTMIGSDKYQVGTSPSNFMVDIFGYLYKDGQEGGTVGQYNLFQITSESQFKGIINGAINRANAALGI